MIPSVTAEDITKTICDLSLKGGKKGTLTKRVYQHEYKIHIVRMRIII